MRPESESRNTFDVLLETVQALRARDFPQIPASLVSAILEIEIRHEENPELAVSEVEHAISQAARGRLGRAGE